MSEQRRNFIFINESFVCENCGVENPVLRAGCRNHCKFCLFSKHVDAEIPGDRASECGALMRPIGLDYNSKKGYVLIHQCLKCAAKVRNKSAEDDDQDLIISLSNDFHA